MNRYKPNYLGKLIPVDNPSEMNKFLHNNYDQFSKIYDLCKDNSESINDVKLMKFDESSLNIKVFTNTDILNNLKNAIVDDSIIMINDVITAK